MTFLIAYLVMLFIFVIGLTALYANKKVNEQVVASAILIFVVFSVVYRVTVPIYNAGYVTVTIAETVKKFILFAVICIVEVTICAIVGYDGVKLVLRHRKFFKQHRDVITYVGIAVLYFIYSMSLAPFRDVWGDEVYTLGNSQSGFGVRAVFDAMFRTGDLSSPLFNLLMSAYQRVVPYGLVWLRLPSCFFMSTGIFFCGLTGRERRGFFCGLLMSVFTATSVTLFEQATFQYRSYALLFLLSTVAFYLYEKETTTNAHKVLYTFVLFSIAYTHYMGTLLVLSFGLFDIFRVASKQLKFRNLSPYFATGILFSIYVMYIIYRIYTGTFPNGMNGGDRNLLALVKNVNPFFASKIHGLLLLLGVFAIFQGHGSRPHDFLAIWSIIFLLASTFIISNYIYTNPSITFILSRYYIGIYGFGFYLMAVGTEWIIDFLRSTSNNFDKSKYPVLFLLCVFGIWSFVPETNAWANTKYQTWFSSGDYLLQQTDLYDADVAVVENNPMKFGFRYFLTKNESLPEVKLFTRYFYSFGDLDAYDTLYIHYHSHNNGGLYNYLNENFYEIERNDEVDVVKFKRNMEE